MTARLRGSLREAPVTVPALVALALFVVWAGNQAGYPVTHWAPGGLIVLALLGVAVSVLHLRATDVPLPVRIALGCLAAYTALSYASILWAAVPGDAWEGANRTLLYLLVFALFACWRQQGVTAALLLGAWTLAMAVLAAFVLLHVDGAGIVRLQSLVPGGRLNYPSGYPNANAAQWLMAFWPALLLARSARLHWGLRGALGGAAVLLAEVALLSQSRGSLYATPIMLVLVFVLLPQRLRTFAVLVPVAVGIGAAAPAVLGVGNNLTDGLVTSGAVHKATAATFAAALVVGLVVALGAAIEGRADPSADAARRIRRGTAAIAITTLVLLLAGGLAAAGNPVTRVRHAWDTFKSGQGYAANSSGSRLTSGLGSNRYDFYRVALDEFLAHPVLGIGADNYQEQYLTHGRSDETPHYPHSVELRTISQTGVVGAILALVGFAAALLAGARALRSSIGDERLELSGSVAAAALAGFAYWVVHGSFDWFWEFAGLGAPAFALLGMACALAPSGPLAAPASQWRGTRQLSSSWRRALAVAMVAVALLGAASLTLPWLSQLQVESAARIWTSAPRRAYARLNDAAQLNPLSDEAYLVAGNIALRFGDLQRAHHEFALALKRTPGDAYAMLELGAIASVQGDHAEALGLLERAARLNPRDEVTRVVLTLVRRSQPVNLEELDTAILRKAEQLL
jgi:O-antigen ligase